MGGARKRSAAGGMKRSASLCGRGCRSAGAVAWRFSAGAGDTIERQLPAGKAQSTIGKQLHSAKQGIFGTSNLSNRSIATRILPQCIIGKQLPPGTAQSTIGKQLHSAKQTTIGTSNLPNHQHRDAHPAEPAPSGSSFTAQSKAPSGRATCRTSTIGKRMFWQIMVPNGVVLRG